MKRCGAISDMHGFLDNINLKPELDYLFIGGDIVPLKIQNYSKESEQWIKNTFIPWLNSLKIKERIIIVAGNHDWYFERHPEVVKRLLTNDENRTTYLENEVWEDDNIKIYGTPLCKIFGFWAFMKHYQIQNKIFNEVSDDIFQNTDKTSIILSHDSAYGASDILLQEDCVWRDGKHIGNTELRALVERTSPKYHLHGHLHSTNHEAEYIGQTETRCVSLLDENYEVSYEPYYFEI